MLPLFPVTTVGSFPRSGEVLQALKTRRRGEMTDAQFQAVADGAVREVLALQHECGVDLVTDGEQRRDNFYSFVSEKLDGVRLMSLAEMLDYVEDKGAFEKLLQSLDVPAFSIHNPTCVGKIARRLPLALGELEFVKQHSDRPVKVPLPGPYLLTRAMWMPEISGHAYASKEELGDDVVDILRAEVADLIAAGADFIQFDEPVLTELVFTQGQTRTFMCAALAARKDPAEELAFAVELLNRVTAGFFKPGPQGRDELRFGLHVCRGNWSRNEATLLSGSYAPLAPYFAQMNVHQLVLEYATPRAGDLMPFEGKELGLGVANPRTNDVEDAAEIAARVRQLLTPTEESSAFTLAPEAIFLNPDCGFGTFSARPMNDLQRVGDKLRAIGAAAQLLRDSL